MGKTKMFLRFLDHLGLGNYVGPEELETKIPNADQKFAEFVNTPEGRESFNEDVMPYLEESPTKKSDNIFSSLGSNNLTPEMGNIISQFLKTQS